MTQRLDKIKMDKIRGPNSKLITNGPEAQNENKHSSPDKIGRLHTLIGFFTLRPGDTSDSMLEEMELKSTFFIFPYPSRISSF